MEPVDERLDAEWIPSEVKLALLAIPRRDRVMPSSRSRVRSTPVEQIASTRTSVSDEPRGRNADSERATSSAL
jgi:hypothetical protein